MATKPQPGRAAAWRRRLFVLIPGVAAIALVVVLVGTSAPLFERLRNIVFDSYQRLAPRPEAGASIAVVDIDEASIARVGQWPWPRSTIARLLDQLLASGAATVAFDMSFSEPDRTSPSAVLADLEKRGVKLEVPADLPLDNDAVLAKSFAGSPVVAGFAMSNETAAPLPPPKAGFSFGGADPKSYLPAYSGGVADLPALNDAAAGLGFFSFPLSSDGVVRTLPVVASAQGNLYPALAVEALRVAQGAGSFAVRSTGAESGEADTGTPAMTAFKDGELSMPTGPGGEFRIYYSGLENMPTISASDLLDPATAAAHADDIAGRIVLVGTSAVGLRDLVATPFGSAVPGVRVHAEIIDQIVGQTFLDRPDWAFGAEVTLAVLFGLIVLALELAGGAVGSGIATIVLVAASVGLSWWAFRTQHLLLDPIVPAATALLALAATTPLLLLITDRERRFIRGAFDRYLSPEMVGRLAANPSALKLGGELRELTILFSDIRDFTTLSEQLAPAELTALLNNFLTPATDVLLKSEATIDKYIGDAIVAFWNAPLDVADHRRKACLGALQVLAALEVLNRSGRPLRIGIGLNSGTCAVGNFGSAQRFSYSALGDDMNLASRVESLTKQYRVPILVTENTRAGAVDLAFLEVDRVQVVGRTAPVPVFALLGDAAHTQTPGFAALQAEHDRFLAAYRGLDFRAADRALAAARDLAPAAIAGLYDVYATRLVMMRLDPPGAGWDGVFVAKQK